MRNRGLMILGFVIAYPVATFLAVLSLVATQAMKGNESRVGLLLGYTFGWAVLFGVAGALPRLVASDATKSDPAAMSAAKANLFGFGVGGGVAGGLIGLLIVIGHLGGSAGAVLGGFAIPLTVPWIFGVLLSRWFLIRIRQSGPPRHFIDPWSRD